MGMRPHDEIRTKERAVCELCDEVISTVNGGRRTALGFISFESLLDKHMAEKHPNLSVLPEGASQRKAA